MTTVTKSTAAPFSVTAYTNPKGLLATTTATASFDHTGKTGFSVLATMKLYVVGQSSAEEEPTKSMTKWHTDTAASRKTNSVDTSSNVSSFAIIVDLTTKAKLLANVYCGLTTTEQNANTAAAPTTTCATTWAPGAIGNQIGFWIQNGTTTTSILNGFQVRQTVLTNGTANTAAAGATANGVPATFGPVQGTYSGALASGVTIAAYSTAQTTYNTAAITFGATMIICDAAKWDPATACHGVDAPWASTTYVDYIGVGGAVTTAVPGTVRAWHFLAEKNADVAKNFQIEKDNKINWIVQETYQTWTGTNAVAIASAHAYGTFTSTGATSTILGATAIIAGVVASMF